MVHLELSREQTQKSAEKMRNQTTLKKDLKICFKGWEGGVLQSNCTFKLLLQGYLPPAADRRESTLERKRKEYFSFIDQYYDTRHQDMHAETFRQVT